MDEYTYGIYVMLLTNLKMNYQIMSALVRHDNPIFKEWKYYIKQTEVELQDLKQQLDNYLSK